MRISCFVCLSMFVLGCTQFEGAPENVSRNAPGTGSAADARLMSVDPRVADAAPSTGTTDPDCPAGQHKCGDACVDSRDPNHCGNACVPCPAPAGGTATCDGTRCGVECPAAKKPCLDGCIDETAACNGMCKTGKNPCNGICVDATSVSSCGTACATCPTSPNGDTTCDGDKCLLTCRDGYHACGNRCLSNKDPMSCGTGCTACPAPAGGTATCDGTMCGVQCPTGMTPCHGTCILMGKSCEGSCPNGMHDCMGNCVANTDVASCGTSCMPCKVPAHATASCDGTKCDFTCDTGFHLCNGQCVDNKSINSCGPASCSACPMSLGGTPACDGTQCSTKCNGNLNLCPDGSCRECCNDGQCAPKGDKHGTCNAGVCQYSCAPGLNDCGGNSCKRCCSDNQCPNVGDKPGVCNGGTCGAGQCPGGKKSCGDLCRECCDGETKDCGKDKVCLQSLPRARCVGGSFEQCSTAVPVCCEGKKKCGLQNGPDFEMTCQGGKFQKTKTCASGICKIDTCEPCGAPGARPGDRGQLCCNDGSCNAHAVCSDKVTGKGVYCQACGEENLPCCEKTQCWKSPKLICNNPDNPTKGTCVVLTTLKNKVGAAESGLDNGIREDMSADVAGP